MEDKIIEHAKILLSHFGDKEIIIESLKTQYSLSDAEVRKLIDDLKKHSD